MWSLTAAGRAELERPAGKRAPKRRALLAQLGERGNATAHTLAGFKPALLRVLAESGWAVAITGRTVHAGEGRDDSDTGEGRPLPGSLEETATLVRQHGVDCLELAADLHDLDGLRRAVSRVTASWGGVDLLVNNAVDTGPGSMVPFVETSVEQLSAKLDANVVAQFVLIQAVLPGMLEQGRGIIIDEELL